MKQCNASPQSFLPMLPTLMSLLLLLLFPTATTAQPPQTITECSTADQETCAQSNRVCYNYESTDTRECGYCINGYIEIQNECYNIDNDLQDEKFELLDELLEEYLPDYIDESVSIEERTERFVVVAKIVSFWNSFVPPPVFSLGITKETFLTKEERKGRLGILANRTYVPDYSLKEGEDGRGELGRFETDGGGWYGTAAAAAGQEVFDEIDPENRSLKQQKRRLQTTVDWHADGYTTRVKEQGLCGCCWAVSTAAAIESALLITNQTKVSNDLDRESLSFQQMISCDDRNSGCGGGNILYATKYAWENNDFGNEKYGGLVSYGAFMILG